MLLCRMVGISCTQSEPPEQVYALVSGFFSPASSFFLPICLSQYLFRSCFREESNTCFPLGFWPESVILSRCDRWRSHAPSLPQSCNTVVYVNFFSLFCLMVFSTRQTYQKYQSLPNFLPKNCRKSCLFMIYYLLLQQRSCFVVSQAVHKTIVNRVNLSFYWVWV